MSDSAKVLPAVSLRGITVLPGMIVHFDISRSRSVKAIEQALLGDQRVFLVTQKAPETENPPLSGLFQVGCIACIKQVAKLPNKLLRVLVEGVEKAELLGLEQEEPFLLARTAACMEEDPEYPKTMTEAMERSIRELIEQYVAVGGKLSKELSAQILNTQGARELFDQTAIHMPWSWQSRQRYLEAMTLQEKYEVLGILLTNEVNVLGITRELQKELKSHIDKNQREYILREQLKVIRKELGEERSLTDDAQDYLKKTEELQASDEVKERLREEIRRFQGMNAASAESSVLRNYIETLLALPWDHHSEDNEDLKKAWEILQESHYGLKEVKERIMEFLSVRKLTHKGKSPILCLVGPPGTGKTSIAKSVAEALDKKYVRVCLGGVRDEAEIRGHRKTYVGAMPGRITEALRQAGVGNPLMLLDEIDKTGSDYKGDTASALLEVLDPEQNSHFTDHFVEIPQDLSEVLFIATANDLQEIPRPLIDRMEVLEISGYTQNEKEHIAREHLIPKQMEANGIPKGTLTIGDGALKKMINNYTKEAGVRGLERLIGRICRKTARLLLEEGKKKVSVTGKNLEEFLGQERYSYLMANKHDEVGIARGLAWTQVGGDTLEIEVNVMPGKGELVLTGQLGDVMKESAQAGISYIRSVAADYGISQEFFQENDIHVHIPEGAVPKDGPSAGITMATAMLSAILKEPVRADLAMTGEITLRGHVLPIGGLKEKLLAAKYARLKEVLVPKENKPDIKELDEEITDGLKISFVEDMGDVLQKALVEHH